MTGEESAQVFAPAGEGLFGLAFTHAPIGMAIFGPDRRLRRANRALCVLLGYSQRDLLGHSLLDFTHPDDRRKEEALSGRLFRGELPSYQLAQRFITGEGRQLWLNLTTLLIGGDRDNPSYGLTMAEDVTERRGAEEALRASEERYRSFVVNSSEGIWRFETGRPIDTSLPADEQLAMVSKHGYLAECNDAMARMYGFERADDLVGANIEVIRSAVNPTIRINAHLFIENGYRLLNAKSSGVDTQGCERFFSSNIIGVVTNGHLLRIWGTQRDETERKVFEDQIDGSRRRMRALVAHLQSLSEKERADIARELHDVLGQGLTGLKMDISWLGKKLPLALAEGTRVEVDTRLREMARLLGQMISAVRNLSTELRPGVLDKFGLSAAVEWQCREFARRTGLPCACHLPESEPSLSTGHSTALFRILQEALTNVARHAGADGVRVELHAARSLATLIVRDDGRGVTVEELSSPTSLGLLGMRERAETLGGSLTVERLPSGGTVVQASIPFDDDGE